ncbi:hypothetical protein HELRODRAFT_177299 [Helobdella robusta]|uniref:Cyclic nucleotide-binding domain-containing protein n=1 Tax=Helobdella robusta TaxID=6412 RepID=T1FBH1_HELRO|nr:hypothetical protein HELRODRAFT_177299 [Helobdella robusta]ESN98065.1 hypothetical protein HELRODRAFT_177299 [Helobdella robusta]
MDKPILMSSYRLHKKFLKNTQENLKDQLRKLKIRCLLKHKRRIAAAKSPLVPNIDGQLSAEETYKRKQQFRRLPPDFVWMDIIRKVVLMITAYGAMQKRGCLLERVTYRNIIEQYRVAINTTTASGNEAMMSSNVKYNPKDYAASKKFSIPTGAVKIMQKPMALRTHKDIMTIYAIMMDLPIFQNYSTKLRWSIARHVKYFKCEPKRVLTLENRHPIRVYFIYSGIVNVVFKEEEGSNLIGTKKKLSLKRGACIGHTGKTRLCVCATNCEFLAIYKTTYIKEGIDAVQVREAEDRFEFFRKWSPIDSWSDNAVYDLANISYTEGYPSGSFILHNVLEKDSDVVLFVLQGKLDVVKVTSNKKCHDIEKNKSLPKTLGAASRKFLDPILKQVNPKNANDVNLCNPFIKNSRQTTKFSSDKYSLSSLVSEVADVRLTNIQDSGTVLITPIYVGIRTLYEGECYGLERIQEEKDSRKRIKNQFCLISRDCVVIKLSGSLLLELIQHLGVDKNEMRKKAQTYQDETTICDLIEKDLMWKQYKQSVIETQVLSRPTIRKSKNFLNHVANETRLPGVFNQAKYMFPQQIIRLNNQRTTNPLYQLAENCREILAKLEKKNRSIYVFK